MSRPVFGPASEKQRIVLQDNTTDVLLVGGGKFCASTLKQSSNSVKLSMRQY